MSTENNKLCAGELIQGDIAQRLSASGPVVGFGFEILLTAIMPALIQAITGCLGGGTAASTIAGRLAQPDFLMRQRVAIEVRKELKEQGIKADQKARDATTEAVLASLAADRSRTEQFVEDIRSESMFSMV
jgi:tetrahydromethanopterin S-methyltransferase subunit F